MAHRSTPARAGEPVTASGGTDDAAVASPRLLPTGDQRRSRAGKPSWGGLVLRALPIVLLATGCSVGPRDAGVAPVTIRTLPPPAVEAPDLLVSEAGARAELVAALAATFPSYEYETTVTIDDSVMMLVSGEVSGLTEHGRVAKGGSVVEYLRTTTGEWVLGPGDRHLATDDVAAGVAPLDGLLGAEAFAVGHDATDRSVLEAVYAGGAFGVPDVDEVAVSLTIRNGKVSKVRYEVPVDGGTARVVTLITSQIDQRYGAGRDIRAAE